MAETFANFDAITTLAADCDDSETTLSVADASGLDTGGNLRIRIDDELILVTAVAGNDLTVTRGIENTTAAAHTSGKNVWPMLTAGGLVQALSEVDSGVPIDLTSEVTGALPIANGGTGQSTATAALNALLPSQSGNSGKLLSTDGTNPLWFSTWKLSPVLITDDATASPYQIGVADLSSKSIVFTLPTSPQPGDVVGLNLAIGSGTRTATLQRAGSQTIGQSATSVVLYEAGEHIEVTWDGSRWVITSRQSFSVQQYWVSTPNGHGSSDGNIRRLTVTVSSRGNGISYSTSAANGSIFTMNYPGKAEIERADFGIGGATSWGVSVNASGADLNTNYASLAEAKRAGADANTLAGVVTSLPIHRIVAVSDTVRGHDNTTKPNATDSSAFMRVTLQPLDA